MLVTCGVVIKGHHSHSWATVAFRRTSGLSKSSFSHILKAPPLTVVPALAVSILMSLSTVKPLAVAMWISGKPTVIPFAVFMWMSGKPEYMFWFWFLDRAAIGRSR